MVFFSDLMSLNLYNNITNTYVDITGNYPPVSSNMAIAGNSTSHSSIFPARNLYLYPFMSFPATFEDTSGVSPIYIILHPLSSPVIVGSIM